MRLVIKYSIGDGCTYSCEVTRPVEYESAEAFAVEFEQAAKSPADSSRYGEFDFAGYSWEASDFVINGQYYEPSIMTIDEWFASEND